MTVYMEEEGITGVALATSIKTGQFGRSVSGDTKSWKFSNDYPLIGLWGFNSDEGISALGVIRYDTTSECYEDLQANKSTFSEVDESGESKGDGTKDEADSGISVLTIGLYTAGIFLAVLIVFIILITIEKIRKKRKRVTEVIQMPEFDVDKHIKNQIEAGTIVNFSPSKKE